MRTVEMKTSPIRTDHERGDHGDRGLSSPPRPVPDADERLLAVVAVVLVPSLAAAAAAVAGAFLACFGTLLAVLAGAQLRVAASLHRRRFDILLELHQTVALALCVGAGTLATLASFLFATGRGVGCALRGPLVLTCLTFMGSNLVARAWRIGGIIGSTSSLGSAASLALLENEEDQMHVVARSKVMSALTQLSLWGKTVCGRDKRNVGKNTGIRRKITFADSMIVLGILMLPQLILQIISLSIPTLRMESVDSLEGHPTCESTGPWVLIVGAVLAAVPFFLSLLLNIQSDGIPDKFRDFDGILTSMATSFCVLIITLPAATMAGDAAPSARAYLLSASVLGLVLPLCYHIAWKRVHTIAKCGARCAKASGTDARGGAKTTASYVAAGTHGKDNPSVLEAAEISAVMANMFDTMGRSAKALEIDADILTKFKLTGDFSWEEGFTSAEVHGLGPKSLELVVSTLIGSGRRWNEIFLLDAENREAKSRAVSACVTALHVFKLAPSKSSLKDRSVVFSGYSFLSGLAKMGMPLPLDNRTREETEKDLAQDFVLETRFQQYHHCRALAMQADVLNRQGNFKKAIKAVRHVKSIYVPKLHSRAIEAEYRSDHCADIIAASVNWLHYLNRTNEATRLCDYLVGEVLPEIGDDQLVSKANILVPVCRFWKGQGQVSAARALKLYESHIAGPATQAGPGQHPVTTYFTRPMMILLKACSANSEAYPAVEDDTAFMLNGEEKYPAWMESTSVSYIDVAASTLMAEACLRLATLKGCKPQDKSWLFNESFQFLKVSETTLVKDDHPIAYSAYSHTLSELQQTVRTIGENRRATKEDTKEKDNEEDV